MTPIFYIWRKTVKNRLRQTLKKPAELVMYLAIVGFAVFMITGIDLEPGERSAEAVTGYSAILLGAFLLIGFMSIWNGLKQGTALFSMADVNLLFTAPVGARKVLLSGIARQAAIMVLASIFMLFQYPNMVRSGLGPTALAGLVVSYALIGICTNILAAAVYAYTAGSEKKRSRVYNAILVFCLLMLAGGIPAALKAESMLTGITGYFGARAWDYLPLFGWGRGLAAAFALEEWSGVILYTALMLACIGLCVLLLTRTSMDYYEDVLLAAERADQVREDMKAGRSVERGEAGKRTKRELGPLFGHGALAFTGRMLREQARRGVSFLDMMTLGAVGGPLMGLVFFPMDMIADIGYWGVIGMTLWLLIFLQAQSGIARELGFTAIYLSPQPAFYKLVAVLLPGVLKSCVDGVVFGACLMLFFGGTVADFFAGIIIYVSMLLLFASGTVVAERMLGSGRNRVLTMLVYVLLLLVLCVPGIIIANIFAPTLYTGYLLFTAWNAGVSALILFLCRNILHAMDN